MRGFGTCLAVILPSPRPLSPQAGRGEHAQAFMQLPWVLTATIAAKPRFALSRGSRCRIFFIRASLGATTGTVSMVLAIAISNNAVKASLVMICLSSRMLAKMIAISALVCSSQPMMLASPGAQFRMRPARRTPSSLPAIEATRSSAAAMKTAAPPTSQLVRSPVLEEEDRHHRAAHGGATGPSCPGRTSRFP